MKKVYIIWLYFLFALFLTSCTTTPPPPLTYLASEKPKGVISTKVNGTGTRDFPRGGFYFLNNNFRPPADIKYYVEQTAKEANTPILRNADIQLNIPIYFDLLLVGYAKGTDTVTTK